MWYLVCTLNISKKRWLFYELLLPGILAFCIGLFYLKSKEINILCKFTHKTKLITSDTLIVWTPARDRIFILPLVGSLKTTSISGSCSVRTQEPAPDVSCQSRCQTAWGPTYTIYIVQPSRPATSRASNKGSRRFHNLYPIWKHLY